MKHGKKIISMTLSLVTVASMLCINANALTYKGSPSYAYTSGSQSIKITARGYTDVFEPSGGVHVYYWGVKAYTPGYNNSNTITTKFTISGYAHSDTLSDPFSGTGTGESLSKSISSTSSVKYNYVTSTIKTSSSVYGTSSQNCNFSS